MKIKKHRKTVIAISDLKQIFFGFAPSTENVVSALP
jgi:hypothetical protein